MLNRLRDSALYRLVGTGFLILLLQIPVGLIAHTIEERRGTRDAAFEEVTRTWGGAQELIGPIVTVPVVERWEADGKPHERIVLRRFLPKTLSVRGRADTEVRRRGIFDVPLYVAQLHVEAAFVLPDASQLRADGADVLWRRASVTMGIADPKAIRAASALTIGDQRVQWEPGPGDLSDVATGLHAALASLKPGAPVSMAFDLTLGGSGRLAVVPAGDETTVYLASPWADPSFDGATLPVDRSITPSGFEATWRALNLGRNFPSTWREDQVQHAQLSASAFGVSLLSPVDTYRTNERAVKYQLLFLGLTFLCFALVELLASLRVHPLQYLLVGLALCLFYLLLLSLSEQIGFTRAYAIAAVATVSLVTMYVRFILASAARTALMGGILSGLYGFLFVLLQIQDYALLAGSIGLFAVLGAVMWITRRVNWFALGPAQP